MKSRKIKRGHVELKGEMRNANKILVGKPEGKRPLGRLRRRWESNKEEGFKKQSLRVCTGFILLRMCICAGNL
jgi:hypothetical protein